MAVLGSNEYADWSAHLLPWEECQPKLAAFCEKVGLPGTPAGFVAHLKDAHLTAAAHLDAGYLDNADLVIDDNGVPTLKRRRGKGTDAEAERLAAGIERRMPERSLLSIVPHLQGLPGGRPQRVYHRPAAVSGRPGAAGAGQRGDQQGRVLQRLLQVARVRRGAGRQ